MREKERGRRRAKDQVFQLREKPRITEILLDVERAQLRDEEFQVGAVVVLKVGVHTTLGQVLDTIFLIRI